MTIYLSLLVCAVGLVIYFAAQGKASAIGHSMFWVGMLVFLLRFGNPQITLFR